MGFKPEQITELRQKLRLNRTRFALKLRVTPRTVIHWETGTRVPTPPVQVLLRLLDVGIDFDELLKKGKQQ